MTMSFEQNGINTEQALAKTQTFIVSKRQRDCKMSDEL